MKKSYVSLLIVLMVLYANSGIDDLIRCYAIKLIRNWVVAYLVVGRILF